MRANQSINAEVGKIVYTLELTEFTAEDARGLTERHQKPISEDVGASLITRINDKSMQDFLSGFEAFAMFISQGIGKDSNEFLEKLRHSYLIWAANATLGAIAAEEESSKG